MTAPDVALIGLYPPPGTSHAGASGVASYTANLARALSDHGAGVAVVAPDDGVSPTEHRDGDIRVVRGFPRGPGAVPSAARAAHRLGAPVVHLQHEAFLFGGPSAMPGLLAGLGGLRQARRGVVVTMHQVVRPGSVDRAYTRLHRIPLPPVVARAGLSCLQRGIGRMAHRCIVHEQSFRETVPDSVVVPHGVEERATPDLRQARSELGVDPHRFVALCFGFVAPYKGLELALEAGRLAGPGVEVVVAGGEHPRMGGADGYGSGLARAYPSARFTGWVPEADVARWFGAADIAVFPYPSPHASSGALALALAHGTPALVSAALARCVGAPGEMVSSPEPQGLADQLHRLADDPAALGALSAANDRLSRGRSWSDVAAAHLRVYEEVRASAGR